MLLYWSELLLCFLQHGTSKSLPKTLVQMYSERNIQICSFIRQRNLQVLADLQQLAPNNPVTPSAVSYATFLAKAVGHLITVILFKVREHERHQTRTRSLETCFQKMSLAKINQELASSQMGLSVLSVTPSLSPG